MERVQQFSKADQLYHEIKIDQKRLSEVVVVDHGDNSENYSIDLTIRGVNVVNKMGPSSFPCKVN